MEPEEIIIMVQARVGSTRFPEKILKKILHKEILFHQIDRIKKSKYGKNLIIITSTNKQNGLLVDLCQKKSITTFRGSEEDLLDRHYQAALKHKPKAIVKIPSDCPLIDPKIIDQVIDYFVYKYPHYDYVSNLHPATYPDGNDVEIFTMSALEKSWKEAERKLEREHTTPYIWENPDQFKIGNVKWETGFDYSTSHRWTLDYEEDYQFIKEIYQALYEENSMFGLDDILNLIRKNPSIYEINKKYLGRYWYENHIGELKNI
jgi:spore coat polysaccharide biosynthesis protein SpsF